MMEQGLAMQSMGGGGMPAAADPLTPQGGAGGSNEQALVDELVRLLLEGVSPEELIQQGVPQELVEQAMAIAISQSGGGAGMPPPGPEAMGGPAAPPATEAGMGLAASGY